MTGPIRTGAFLLVVTLAVNACGGSVDEAVDDPVASTATPQTSSVDQETTPSVGVDFGDDGAATDFLAALFMPRSGVTDGQVDCINDEMEESYPDGLPDPGTDEMEEALSSIVDACDLLPG